MHACKQPVACHQGAQFGQATQDADHVLPVEKLAGGVVDAEYVRDAGPRRSEPPRRIEPGAHGALHHARSVQLVGGAEARVQGLHQGGQRRARRRAGRRGQPHPGAQEQPRLRRWQRCCAAAPRGPRC
jgi:hypothetical protein